MNSLDGVMVIGLTGQTGAGKSTVSQIFVDNAFQLIDADKISRLVVTRGSHCLSDLCDCFSDEILTPDGELDRKKMASIAFSDPNKLEMLNSIMYPYIMGEILRMIHHHSQQNHKLILLDAPTLFESRADDFCDVIISVVADADVRKQRIMARDHISEEEADLRMQAQLTEAYFREHSDIVLDNNGTLEVLIQSTQEVVGKIIAYYHNKYKN